MIFQAETEELAMKVDALTNENLSLRSEINRLREKSENLRLENTALMVFLVPFPLRCVCMLYYIYTTSILKGPLSCKSMLINH